MSFFLFYFWANVDLFKVIKLSSSTASTIFRNIDWSIRPLSLRIVFFESYGKLASSLKYQNYSNAIHPSLYLMQPLYLIRPMSLIFFYYYYTNFTDRHTISCKFRTKLWGNRNTTIVSIEGWWENVSFCLYFLFLLKEKASASEVISLLHILFCVYLI